MLLTGEVMEIVKLITKVIDKAVTRNFKFFCNECKKEINISGVDVDDGYYEDWEDDTGTGYFSEGNVFIDFNQGDMPRTHVQCKECYGEEENL